MQGGRGLQGAQAQYVKVPLADATLVAVPAGVRDEEALLLGDILSTGYFCADAKDSQPGKPVFNRTVGLKDSWAKAVAK